MSQVLERVEDKIGASYTLPVMGFNYQGLVAWVNDLVEPYQGQIISEEDIPAVREEMAGLNKVAQALDRARIDTKKEVTAPVTEFERQVNEVKAIVLEARSGLDEQVKAFEEKAREEKKAEVQFIIDDKKDALDCSEINIEINPSWLNKSTSLKSVNDQVEALIEAFKRDQAEKEALEQAKKDRVLSLENHINACASGRGYSLSISQFMHLQELNIPLAEAMTEIKNAYLAEDERRKPKPKPDPEPDPITAQETPPATHFTDYPEEAVEPEPLKELSITAQYEPQHGATIKAICQQLESICKTINVQVKDVVNG